MHFAQENDANEHRLAQAINKYKIAREGGDLQHLERVFEGNFNEILPEFSLKVGEIYLFLNKKLEKCKKYSFLPFSVCLKNMR